MQSSELTALHTQTRLSPDIGSWGEQIVSQLLQSCPSITNIVGEVVFTKIDSIKGNAVGHVALIGKKQRIPFIVDEYQLNPLDIYIDESRHLPLSERTSKLLFSPRWPFRLLTQQERAGILKTSSLLEPIGNEVAKSQREDLVKIAQQFPESIEFFTQQEAPSQVHDFVVRCFVKTASDDKPIVVRDLLTKDAEYSISEFAEKFGKEFTSELMTNKECIVSNLPPSVKLAIDKLELKNCYKQTQKREGFLIYQSEALPAKRYDHFRMSDMNRSSHSGVVITRCGKLILGADVQESTNGKEVPPYTLDAPPSRGQYCAIIIGDNAYGPIFINSITRLGSDTIYSFVDDGMNSCIMRTSPDIKTLVKLDATNYLVGSHVLIVRVYPTTNRNGSETPSEVLRKCASLEVTVVKQGDGKFRISDAGISGIEPNQLKNMGKGDATVALMRCGLSENDAKYALMKALESGSYSFPAPQKEAAKEEAADPALQKQAEVIVNLARKGKLLKVAQISGDRSNVDMALGLNMVTQDNIKRYRLVVPDIYAMLDKLCKLLIMKRMNREVFATLNEQELSNGIKSLDEIAHALNAL